MSLNTILAAGDIQKKLDDKHAELLDRIRDEELTEKRLQRVRSLYAQFGLTPPQLSPDLQALMPASPDSHCFEWEGVGGVAVVRFTTRAIRDERLIRTTFEELERLVDGASRRRMVLNFAGVETFASYALGKLIVLGNKLQPPAGRLALCALTPVIKEIIDINKRRRQFNIYATELEALQSFE
jgi:anti-anti-sigma regulatory factor